MWKICIEPRARALVVPLLASLALLSSTAGAQVVNEESARIAFTEGLRLRDQEHEPRRALEKLKAAHELAVTARTGYELGVTYMMIGSLVEAERLFLEVTRLPEDPVQSAAGKEAREQSRRLSTELESRIPAIVVRVTGESAGVAEVYVDGVRVPDAARSLPWKANPGSHDVVVKAPGQPDRTRRLTLVEGKTESIDVDMASEPSPATVAPPPPGTSASIAPTVPVTVAGTTEAPVSHSPWSTPRIVAVSLAGMGVAAGVVGGALAIGAKSSFDNARSNECGAAIGAASDAQCTSAGLTARQNAGSRADTATVIIAAGGAAVAGGVVLWLVSKPTAHGTASDAIGVGVTPAGFLLRGRF